MWVYLLQGPGQTACDEVPWAPQELFCLHHTIAFACTAVIASDNLHHVSDLEISMTSSHFLFLLQLKVTEKEMSSCTLDACQAETQRVAGRHEQVNMRKVCVIAALCGRGPGKQQCLTLGQANLCAVNEVQQLHCLRCPRCRQRGTGYVPVSSRCRWRSRQAWTAAAAIEVLQVFKPIRLLLSVCDHQFWSQKSTCIAVLGHQLSFLFQCLVCSGTIKVSSMQACVHCALVQSMSTMLPHLS